MILSITLHRFIILFIVCTFTCTHFTIPIQYLNSLWDPISNCYLLETLPPPPCGRDRLEKDTIYFAPILCISMMPPYHNKTTELYRLKNKTIQFFQLGRFRDVRFWKRWISARVRIGFVPNGTKRFRPFRRTVSTRPPTYPDLDQALEVQILVTMWCHPKKIVTGWSC